MRKFRVGDRVRFELNEDSPTLPRWNFGHDGGASGTFARGTVDRIYRIKCNERITVVWMHDGRQSQWDWPQVGHHGARYGSAGYLELVAAVEDQGMKVTTLPGRTQDTSTKTITVQELAELVESELLEDIDRIAPNPSDCHPSVWIHKPRRDLYRALRMDYRAIAKERARAIAESLRGVEVEK